MENFKAKGPRGARGPRYGQHCSVVYHSGYHSGVYPDPKCTSFSVDYFDIYCIVLADIKNLSNFRYCNNIHTLPNKNIAEFTEVNLDPRLGPG